MSPLMPTLGVSSLDLGPPAQQAASFIFKAPVGLELRDYVDS